jgi:spore coat protein U-like protein
MATRLLGNAQHAMLAVLWLALPTMSAGQVYTFTAGMPVRIDIVASCIVTASDLDFGAYNAAAATPGSGQGSIQLQCSPGQGAEVSLDAGSTPGATPSQRQMASASGSDRLHYGLYQDPGRMVNWGETPGVDTLEVLTTGEPQALPVYGQVPAGQRIPAGSYGDVITVRVQF